MIQLLIFKYEQLTQRKQLHKINPYSPEGKYFYAELSLKRFKSSGFQSYHWKRERYNSVSQIAPRPVCCSLHVPRHRDLYLFSAGVMQKEKFCKCHPGFLFKGARPKAVTLNTGETPSHKWLCNGKSGSMNTFYFGRKTESGPGVSKKKTFSASYLKPESAV